jgi:hypothetical protein
MSFEDNLQNSLFSKQSEKTFIDKLLAKDEVMRVREIIKKEHFTRSDMTEILNLLSSNEIKLLNYDEWDRYLMAKYFVWIREFVALAENLYDYEDDLKKQEEKGNFKLSDRSRQIFENIKRYMEHNIKFLIDLYFNLIRSTMSLGATGILELLKNKYEMVYPNQNLTTTATEQQNVKFKWRP